MTINNTSTKNEIDKKAKPTYSRIRTGFLKLTPGDSKCRIYCKGEVCKYCISDGTTVEQQAVRGLYSTWVTENILAMGRLTKEHFTKFNIVQNFQRSNIRAVVNLEEWGEHAFCGPGIGSSGFSYEPEELMRHNIFYYNFPVPDFGSCAPARLLDIAKVADHALTNGRIAVHCHAGHGRTGMIIAALLMYQKGMSAHEAVALVRRKRPQSVQSIAQVHSLNLFEALIRHDGGTVLPHTKCTTCADYVLYSSRFLSKTELRLYGGVPKVIYLCIVSVLNRFYSSVQLIFDPSKCSVGCFKFECNDPKGLEISEDDSYFLLVRNYSLACETYQKMTARGMNLVNVERCIKNFDALELIRFLDYFFMSTFHQLATCQEVQHAIHDDRSTDEQQPQDWRWCLYLLISMCLVVPASLRGALSALIAEWFTRKRQPIKMKIEEICEEILGKTKPKE